MTKSTWEAESYDGFGIIPLDSSSGAFILEVDAGEDHYGKYDVELDALEVYRVLKYYFKGTYFE